MSDSETTGRCRREITAAYESTRYKPSDSDMLVADAIDRLAADVEAIKARVEQIAPEDLRHLFESEKAWVKLVEEQRDAAVRERNEARALLELAQVQRTAAYADRDEARAEVYRLKCSMTETSKERDAAIRERDEARAKVERLKAELAAPQPAAPPGVWLTDKERAQLWFTLDRMRRLGYPPSAEAIESILARAGSPPVVVVPALEFLGDMTGREQGIVLAYRDALDAAGVAWKEVGRE